jgi:hypothetical protein
MLKTNREHYVDTDKWINGAEIPTPQPLGMGIPIRKRSQPPEPRKHWLEPPATFAPAKQLANGAE